MNKMRIAKYLSAQNICSRREAERHIAEGHVTVNGRRIDSPVTFVGDSDVLMFCGRKVASPQTTQNSPYERAVHLWLYHKPAGEITTHRDPQGRPTVFQTAQRLGLPRVISVGRLDLNSEGLLLLTDSARLATVLERPSKDRPRVYRVRLFGRAPTAHFWRLAQPIQGRGPNEEKEAFRLPPLTVEGIHYAPFTIAFEKRLSPFSADSSSKAHNFWAEITLTEGKNREIRKLMGALGWQVNRLIRLSYGPFVLGDLKPGHVRRVPIPKVFLQDGERLPSPPSSL